MNTQIVRSIQSLQLQAASLLLYQSVLESQICKLFLELLDSLQGGEGIRCLHLYGQWFRALATAQQSWQDHLIEQILSAENPFSQQIQHSDLTTLPSVLVTAAQQDLRLLQSLYNCDSKTLSRWVQEEADLASPLIAWELAPDSEQAMMSSGTMAQMRRSPAWSALAQSNDWGEVLTTLAAHYQQVGVGLFAHHWAFRWQEGHVWGIPYPDAVRLEDLVGYDAQRTALVTNTEALLAGYRALHVLLYGSRGSGKSSLVKGLLWQYGDRGLRLIEVSKTDLKDLTLIVDQLRHLPQKFVIFVDDLSFEEDEDTYKALKVVLEGNLTARPTNIVVYATSNRRHLIREFFGDRPRPSDADEVHAWDTVQEKLSFSDRFGLTLTFEPANQDTYLAIVRHLAQQANLAIAAGELEYRALQWATRHNGRSGRTARQFVDFLQAEQGLRDQSSHS